jgi:unsaturated chondroitin disaccharide hydrolase
MDANVIAAVGRADAKLRGLIAYLENTYPGNYAYHFGSSTNAGVISTNTGGWAYGYFSATLWRMYDLAPPGDKNFWLNKALLFSARVKNVGVQESPTYGDFGNIFQTLVSAYSATGDAQWRDAIINHATAKETNSDGPGFKDVAGTYGYWRSGDTYWHSFADHTPDLEMMFWAGARHANPTIGNTWIAHALSHALKFSTSVINPKTSGITPPTRTGSCQRCYFDLQRNGIGTGNFLYGKKGSGWNNETTWGRGHSWITWGLVAAYAVTRSTSILTGVKNAINYVINHLPDHLADQPSHPRRIIGDHIPLWDYDYTDYYWCHDVLNAWDTSQKYALIHDSSAASIAASAILRLVQVLPPGDPDKQAFWDAGNTILHELSTSPYLSPSGAGTNAGLITNCFNGTGDYQKSQAWGDYYFLDAIKAYVDLQNTLYNPIMTQRIMPRPINID